jgi:hypothetical protein
VEVERRTPRSLSQSQSRPVVACSWTAGPFGQGQQHRRPSIHPLWLARLKGRVAVVRQRPGRWLLAPSQLYYGPVEFPENFVKFFNFSSHRIFGHMHEALNIDKK